MILTPTRTRTQTLRFKMGINLCLTYGRYWDLSIQGTPVSDDAHGKRMVLGHIIVFLWHFSRYSWGSVVNRGSLKLCNTGIMNPGTEVTYVTLQVSMRINTHTLPNLT